MVKKKKRSVLPVYTVGAVWLCFALSSHLYQISNYISAVIVSLVAYAVARMIWPDKVYELPDPAPTPKQEKKAEAEKKTEPDAKPEAKTTGNPKIDALIEERGRAISEMRRLNDNIQDETISAQIDRMEETTTKIVDHVVAHPEKLPQIRKFMNYYLPTTLKLLNAYDRMDSTGISGENIDGTKTKIEDMLETIVKAFDKQLDALFRDEAMDISSDITVMENMLAQEGLGGMQFQ